METGYPPHSWCAKPGASVPLDLRPDRQEPRREFVSRFEVFWRITSVSRFPSVCSRSPRLFPALPRLFSLPPDLLLPALHLLMLAPRIFLLAPGHFLLAPGLFLLAPGLFLLAPGLFLLARDFSCSPRTFPARLGSYLARPADFPCVTNLVRQGFKRRRRSRCHPCGPMAGAHHRRRRHHHPTRLGASP